MDESLPPCLRICGHKVRVSFDYPPIPDRSYDWSATTEDYEPGHPIGRGPTKLAALQDLRDQLEEQ